MSFRPTKQQRLVVEHPLEPLRVAAGAGTGKTATLAARIVHLVDHHGLEPERVLGITFTNKATEELADRIRLALGDRTRAGRQVEVHTYHGFAHRILEEFGALVGVERQTKVITPAFGRQVLREVLGGGDWEVLDLTRPATVIGRLARLAADLGDNLRTPADLLAQAPPARAGDQVWSERVEMAEALLLYEERKRRLGAVDYPDLIRLAHLLLERHPEVAGRLRDRYDAVLLDEYQDTNPAQRELLLRIFGGAFPVTAVGDASQTIYEWRGASLENFARFPEHFALADGSPAPTLALSTNRRSGREILALANLVQREIDPEAVELRHRRGAGPAVVATRWLRSATEEARWIGAEAARLHEEGFRWRDMALLFRKTKDMALVRDALEAEEIPVEVASLGGLLQVPEVADLHAWLRILGDPEDSPALVRILLGSRFRLGLADLVPLAGWIRDRSRQSEADEDHERLPSHTLLEAIEHPDELEGLSAEAAGRLEEFHTLYRELVQVAQGASLVELCREVLDRVGAWPEVEAMSGSARLSARLNLYRFLDLAEAWSPLEGRPSLAAFLDHLQLLSEEGAEELDSARLSGEDAVALLTVHRAKGLEWPVVFLPALYEGNFPARARHFEDPHRHPEVLPYPLRLDAASLPLLPEDDEQRRKEVLRERNAAQEWRTAYVAVTRAARRLYLSGAYWYGQKQPASPGPLYQLGREVEGGLDLGHREQPGDRPEALLLDLSTEGAPDPLFREGWEEALRATLEDPGWPEQAAAGLELAEPYARARDGFRQMLLDLPGLPADRPPDEPLRVSVTGLVTYAACPKRFYWTEVDRLPRRPTAARRRGVEFHRRVELHNRGSVPLEEAFEADYDLAPAEQAPGGRGPDPFSLFLGSRFARSRPASVEVPFDLKVGEARVRGRIDALYRHPDRWELVDYKSGSADADPAMRVQLQAYVVAVRETGLVTPPPDRLFATFAFFGEGVEERVEEVTPAWEEAARSELARLVGAIGEERYEPAPSEACRRCDFLKFCPAGRERVGSGGG